LHTVDGCYLFDADDDKVLTECPHCGKKRPGDKKLQLIDIAAKMSELLDSADTREEVEYRHNNSITKRIYQQALVPVQLLLVLLHEMMTSTKMSRFIQIILVV
jgi:hypothetical protein